MEEQYWQYWTFLVSKKPQRINNTTAYQHNNDRVLQRGISGMPLLWTLGYWLANELFYQNWLPGFNAHLSSGITGGHPETTLKDCCWTITVSCQNAPALHSRYIPSERACCATGRRTYQAQQAPADNRLYRLKDNLPWNGILPFEPRHDDDRYHIAVNAWNLINALIMVRW